MKLAPVLVVTVMLAWASGAAALENESIGPASVWPAFKFAYQQKSPAALAALLSGDYRYHSAAFKVAKFAEGFSRENELRAIQGMMLGVKQANGHVMPPADTLWFDHSAVRVAADPEHADSTQHYRTLQVDSLSFHVRAAGDRRFDTPSGLHVFHLVRGDAAVLAEGQTADANRWYIRRWLDNTDEASRELASIQGECGEKFDASGAGAPKPRLLGIRALTNPACARLEVMLDLPGTEPVQVQVLDVTGRVRNTRKLDVPRAGEMRIDAGEGAGLTPGVYWVRVAQGTRKPSTRMVVVAR